MAHEYFKERLDSHALSALDAGEERALKEHLATCQNCREELDEWRSTASALAFAVSGVEPSPQLRERILAQIRTERDATGTGASSPAPPAPANVVPFALPRKNIWASVGSLGAIAAALMVGVLLISLFLLWRENRSTRRRLVQLQTEKQTAEALLAREREILAFLTSPGTNMSELDGTSSAPGASATIGYDKNGRAVLLAKGLPAAPQGKAYQLWFLVAGQKLPGRVFTTDKSGNGDLSDEIPRAALGAAKFAVTLEPEAGVKTPTGDVFLISGS